MRALTRSCLPVLAFALLALIPAAAFATTPVNDVPPALSAQTPHVGDEVTTQAGEWTPTPDTVVSDLYVCTETNVGTCSSVSTSGSYTPVVDDVGKFLLAAEVATHEGDESVAYSEFSNPITYGDGIITNGVMGIGVRPTGSLNTDTPVTTHDGANYFGLRLLDGQYDSVAPGSPAEGWGFADKTTGVRGYSNRNDDDTNVGLTSFDFDGQTATSVVTINDDSDAPYAEVTHAFHPSGGSQFLYEIDVTIKPLALSGIQHALYRRNVDWDVEPTAFNEVVSTAVGNATSLTNVSDDGFTSSNPLDQLSSENVTGEFFSEGPADIGAAFDFDFGAIPFGSTKEFKIYYGAAPDRSSLMGALEDAGVETFSIAHNSNESGYDTGAPAIFALGFSGVGGDPVIDSTAPTANISDGPAERTNATTGEFTLGSDQVGSTFVCKLDAQSYVPCTSPVSYAELSEGDHKLQVRAINNGATQLVPTTYNWLVTQHPFELYFDSTPSWWGSSTDATFDLYADRANRDDLTFTCALDGAELAPCDPYKTFEQLEPGAHSVTYRAERDGVTEDITYDWTVSDAVMSRFTSKPDALSNSSAPYFGWETAGPVDGIDCKLDDGDWYDCGGTYSKRLYVLDGEHTFSVRAYDSSDTFQTPVTSWTFTKDTRTPHVTTNLPSVIGTQPFEVTFSTSEPLDHLRCSVNNANYVDCIDGLTLTGLTNGDHELEYEFEDLAGNSYGGDVDFDVDLGAPIAVIKSKPNRRTSSRSAKFQFTGPEGATFECSIDEGDFTPCTSPATYDLLNNEADHVFQVRATKDGDTQSPASWYVWKVTQEPFDLYFDERPSRLTSDTTAVFEIEADAYNDKLLSFKCSLDGADFTVCPSDVQLTDLALGDHKFTVKASDLGESEEISYEWRVIADGEMAAFFTQKPQARSNDVNPYFEWNYSGPVDHFECKVDDDPFGACTGSWGAHQPTGLSEGTHTLQVKPLDVSDIAGTIESYTWKIDLTPPVLSAANVPASFSMPFKLPLTADEDLERTSCTLDGVETNDCGWPIKLTYLSLGQHTMSVRGWDLAGNESEDAVEFSFNVVAPPVDGPPAVIPPPAKPTIDFKKPKHKADKLTLDVTCPAEKCTVDGWVKIGKKKYKLKGKDLGNGEADVKLKFDKKLAKATRKAKKGKVSWSVTVSGGGQATTKGGKF